MGSEAEGGEQVVDAGFHQAARPQVVLRVGDVAAEVDDAGVDAGKDAHAPDGNRDDPEKYE